MQVNLKVNEMLPMTPHFPETIKVIETSEVLCATLYNGIAPKEEELMALTASLIQLKKVVNALKVKLLLMQVFCSSMLVFTYFD